MEFKVDLEKVRAVVNWKVPKDGQEVRSFHGLADYFRRFLQGYSKMVVPLIELDQKE